MSEDFGSKGEETGHWKEAAEEEKKEGTLQRPHRGVSNAQTNMIPDNPIDDEQSDLPEFLRKVHYAEESIFLEELEKNGLRDLRIVVWQETPSDAHIDAVKLIDRHFQTWKSLRLCR